MTTDHTAAPALRRALIAVRELRAELAARTEQIAIIGMGCRFPGGADNPDAFWELLRDGVDAISEVPPDRWDSAALYDTDPAAPGRVSSRWGGFLDQIDRFDAAFFGISPREAAQMDPQQRIMLEVAWEAFESAGQTTERLAGTSTGVFVGVHSHSNDYTWLQFADPGQIDTYTGTGTSHSVVAGRVSYLLDLRGPSVALDTACSSSLVAVHLAVRSLRGGECDLALAGGVNLALGPHFTMATTKMHMMASDGRCKTFDAAADGFVRGEGCGAVVLKRLSDAERDGDPILAVIRGTAVNQDGRTNGLTAPSGLSQQRIVREALRDAGVDPAHIGAVEAHGTGTALGDPIEIEALTEVFGAATRPIALGSVKTNIGHLEAAAGIAGLIKVVLSLRHGAIPAHLHFRTLNPNSTLAGTRFVIPTALRPWPGGEGTRRATVNSFGWSGTNGCLVVEEAPRGGAPPAAPDGRVELLPFSARSPQALLAQATAYRSLLARVTDADVPDICYTASVWRDHHPFRLAVAGRGRDELTDRLTALIEAGEVVSEEPPAGPVFVFSGQGAQWAGMGRDLLAQQPVCAEVLCRCDELIRANADWSLLDEITADPSRLDHTEIAQPALFAVQVALSALWRSWGIEPEAVIGHSVGEIAAAHVAGVLSLQDAVLVAVHRGRVMQQAHGHGVMAEVALPAAAVAGLIAPYGDRLTVAAVNSPLSTVIAGEIGAVDEIVAALTERDVFSRRLRVEYAFHSAQMEPFRAPLVRKLHGISPRPATVPIVSTVTGRPATGGDFGAEYWGANIREPVRFADALAQLGTEARTRAVIEVGPRPVLARSIAEDLDQSGQAGLVLASMRAGVDARTTLLSTLGALYRAGHRIEWAGLHPAGGRRVPLPGYPWQRERHWLRPAARRATRHPASVHPLLGSRVRSAVPIFENDLSCGAIPYLGDHRIHGVVLLPMTGYLELALAAGAARITDLVLHQAVVLTDEPLPVQVVLTGNTFQLFSAQDDAWTLHATGTTHEDTSPGGDRVDLDALRSRLKPVEVAEFSERLAAVGIDHGPTFTGLVRLWCAGDEALGEVRLPDGVESRAYRWHPALLDACLQVALAALPGDQAYLPIGLDVFEHLADPGTPVWSHATVRQDGPEAAVADVELRDGNGGLLARVGGLLLKGAGRTVPDLFYEIDWEPLSLGEPAATEETGAWLIIGDRGGLGAELGESLQARGDRVKWCDSGVELPTGAEPWRGVVRLAGLDAGTDDPTVDEVMSAAEQTVRSVIDLAAVPRLWLVSRGARAVADGDPVEVAQAAGWGLATAITRERPDLRRTCVDLDPAGSPSEARLLLDLLLAPDTEDQIAVRSGGYFVPRLVPATLGDAVPAGPVRLRAPDGGVLADLVYTPVTRQAPRAGEVEIRVLATGLNFRDVLNALGMYPGEALPLGLECAGEIVAVGPEVDGFAVGDRVLALAPASFATVTTVSAARVAHLPDRLGYAEAATIPVAFLTAVYGLNHLARIKPGARVLIHAAAGGVGMAAVRIAQRAGAEVFATAGPAKWPVLRERGVQHVFSSRTLDFADAIPDGVDIVLNSLADEFIPRSIGVLREGGCFLEIGKRGIWDADRVAALRPDIEYHPYDLGAVADADPELISALLRDLVADGRLEPLPLREFPLAHTVDAFRHMARARHVGKIVIGHERRPAVRADATYLITGGRGGLGLGIARWLVAQGAGKVVLLGRGAPSGEVTSNPGGTVVARQADVSDSKALADVLTEIATTMPPLRGIVHAAGVLDDGVLEHQTWERFATVLAPKVVGGLNLHRLTRDLPLDFFLLCSSAASLLGSAGQSGYVTANTVLDALAHHRRSLGLPATSVNWGPWADCGMATNLDGRQRQRLTGQGFRPLTPDQGTEAFGLLIESRAAQLGALAIDWPAYLRQFGGTVPPFFSRVDLAKPVVDAHHDGARARIEAAHPGERERLLHEYVQTEAITILGLPAGQPVSPLQPLRELGLDSLMAVELRNALGLLAGRSLPSTLAFDHPTIAKLAGYLLRELFPVTEEPAPEPPDRNGLVARVAALDEADVEALLAAKLSVLDVRNSHE